MKNTYNKILIQNNIFNSVNKDVSFDKKTGVNIMSRALGNLKENTNYDVELFQKNSVDVFEYEGIIFTIYYAMNNHSDLYIKILLPSGDTNTFKINDMPIDRGITNYSPEILFWKKDEANFLACVFIEKKFHTQGNANTLFLKMYALNTNGVLFSQVKKIELNSYVKNKSVIYKYPVIIRQDDRGDFLVIAKTLKDRRANMDDRIYVMWRVKGNNYEVIKPRSRNNLVQSYYLFKIVGYEKEHNDLIISSNINNGKFNFTYISKHLEQYKFFSKIHKSSINYLRTKQSEDCLVSNYRCIVSGNTVKMPRSYIELIKFINVGDSVHIVYIGNIYSEDLSRMTKQLALIANYGDVTQSIIYDIVNIQEDVKALYVKYDNGNVIVTTIFNNKSTIYIIPANDLLHQNINSIIAFDVDINHPIVDWYRMMNGQVLLNNKISDNNVIGLTMNVNGVIKKYSTKVVTYKHENYKNSTLNHYYEANIPSDDIQKESSTTSYATVLYNNHEANIPSDDIQKESSTTSYATVLYNNHEANIPSGDIQKESSTTSVYTTSVTNELQNHTIVNTLNKAVNATGNNVTGTIKDDIILNNSVTSTSSLNQVDKLQSTPANRSNKNSIVNKNLKLHENTHKKHNLSKNDNILLPFNGSANMLNSSKVGYLTNNNITGNNVLDNAGSRASLLAVAIIVPLFFLIAIAFLAFRYIKNKKGHHRIVHMEDIPVSRRGIELYNINVENAIDRLSEELL
ncbi:hypothetical protein HL033_01310 [Neoehrlichia mikurensis]|uniref:hypothetical protein n=1 Tax=Neoehrlichia mikurensis TaxID=89586 RepID=UPI001C437E48|nr:hypothetical protein [Neoehrlichia mikurensis]QXK92193.1 hypothetical protein IAH97_01305 [Neoehrlichia mikurensis]QXK93886.1 hypothetical protein HL033_01310 [Neoehrlichia mikurensis]